MIVVRSDPSHPNRPYFAVDSVGTSFIESVLGMSLEDLGTKFEAYAVAGINHQYQPPALIKDDNLSIYILISIVDKDFPQQGQAEGLNAAQRRLGSPGNLTG